MSELCWGWHEYKLDFEGRKAEGVRHNTTQHFKTLAIGQSSIGYLNGSLMKIVHLSCFMS